MQTKQLNSNNSSSNIGVFSLLIVLVIIAVILLKSGYFLVIEDTTFSRETNECSHKDRSTDSMTPTFNQGKTTWNKVETCLGCGKQFRSKATLEEAIKQMAKQKQN